MNDGKFAKSIVFVIFTTFGVQLLHETNVIEKAEPKSNPLASISIPLNYYPPIPDHGPHSRSGIVNTMDGIVAVTTSAAFSFIKAL